jgi:hypothetical protein
VCKAVNVAILATLATSNLLDLSEIAMISMPVRSGKPQASGAQGSQPRAFPASGQSSITSDGCLRSTCCRAHISASGVATKPVLVGGRAAE